LFLHLLGFTMWLGGAIAAMIMGIAAKREDRHGLGAVVRAQASVMRMVIAPGALLAVLSGLILTFQMSAGGDMVGFSIWLVIMQGAGLVAALLTLLISLPTATKLSRIDPAGERAQYFDELRQRQRVIASIAGTFGLVALLAGAMLG
jgi:flagellar biosynthesis component FlhA